MNTEFKIKSFLKVTAILSFPGIGRRKKTRLKSQGARHCFNSRIFVCHQDCFDNSKRCQNSQKNVIL